MALQVSSSFTEKIFIKIISINHFRRQRVLWFLGRAGTDGINGDPGVDGIPGETFSLLILNVKFH